MGNSVCCQQLGAPSSMVRQKQPKEINTGESTAGSTEGTLIPGPKQSVVVRPDDFQNNKYLGKGENGSVVLVKKRNSEQLFAMKIMEKSKMKEVNLLQDKFIETGIASANNDFLVRIHYTFQNAKNIYIVMEYVEGGDLYYYLKKEQRFPEDTVRWAMAEVIEGLDFLHSKNLIYRDIKPENTLVTTQGHIKLTDYGLSRLKVQNKPTFTYAGTLQYVAPQILQPPEKGYDIPVDLWGLGILIYQLCHGKTPFMGPTQADIKQKILAVDYKIDDNHSPEYKQLVEGLLIRDPEKRLTLDKVRKLPFFAGVDWRDVKERKNPAPLKQLVEKYNPTKFKKPEDNASRIFISASQKSYEPMLHEFLTEPSQKKVE